MYQAITAAVIAGFILGGCATPALAPSDFAWSYSADPDEGPKLAYGRPQSDDVVLMMTCQSPSQVTLSAGGLSSTKLMLTSGAQSTSIKGAVEQGFAGSDGYIEAQMPTRAPALAGFRQSGDLSLTSGGRTLRLAALDADRPAVRRFFRACEA
jgi:hypothetical protein